MAWKPPTTKAFVAGEIPGKKEISDDEMANLDKYRPNKDVEAMFGQGAGVNQIGPGQSIPVNVPMAAYDSTIVDFLDDLKKQKKFGIGETVLATDFLILIEAEISAAGKDWDVYDALEVAYSRELAPQMFYFGMGMINNEMRVVMTPVKYWEKNKCLDDRSISDYILPDFLSRSMECVYAFDQNMTASQVRKELVMLGFAEKHEIADLL